MQLYRTHLIKILTIIQALMGIGILTPLRVAGKVWHTPAHSLLDDKAHLHLTSSPSASDTAEKIGRQVIGVGNLCIIISVVATWNRYPSIATSLYPDNRRHVWNWRGVDKAVIRPWRQIHFNSYFPTTTSSVEANPAAGGITSCNKMKECGTSTDNWDDYQTTYEASMFVLEPAL